MKIEFWLDYLNPICYLQHKVIESMVEHKVINAHDIFYRNYEMKPGFSPEDGHCLFEVIKSHYRLTEHEMDTKFNQLLKDIKPVKVIDAHRLAHLAKKYQVGFDYHQLLFDSYYMQKLDISDHHVLMEIGLQIGLQISDIKDVLSTDSFLEQVENNRENAIAKGIYELPHLRLEGKINLSGYLTKLKLLNQIEIAKTKTNTNEHCKGEHCHRKKAI